MNREFNQTNAPILRTFRKTIARRVIVDETVKDSNTLLTFPKTISLFVETESFIRLLINGVADDDSHSRYNDFHGYMTSFTDPLEYARARARKLGLPQNPNAVLEVVMVFSQFGGIAFKREDVSSDMFLYHDSIPYKPLPTDWIDVSTPALRKRADTWMAATDLLLAIEANVGFLNGMREELAQHVVYASNLSDAENAEMFAKVLDSSPIRLDEENRKKLLDRYCKVTESV